MLVNQLFTEYRSKAPYARVDREYRDVKPARLTIDTPEKENAFIRGRLDFPLRDDDPDAPALVIADDIFGGGAGRPTGSSSGCDSAMESATAPAPA